MGVFMAMVAGLRTGIVARFFLALENVALRQQLAVLERSGKRPRLRQRDRVFWVLLSALWPDWRSALMIVKPDTVLGWRRRGFRLCWCWKSRSRKPGRPRINEEIRRLIRRMCCEKPTWGAPRIESELHLLGYDVAERTVSNYMVRPRKPRTQTWRTFLNNHAPDAVHIDILKACDSTIRQLCDFPILRQIRRLFSYIRSAMAHRTARPAFGEELCLLAGDGDGTARCHNQQRSPGSRVDKHPRGSNELACLWLHRESTRVRKRGPPRQDDRITISADWGMHRTYARAA
jgi:hypothetical protein